MKQRKGGKRAEPKELRDAIDKIINIKDLLRVPQTIDQIPKELPYMPGVDRKPVLHNGQFKLLLGEIDSLSVSLSSSNDVAYVIYVGAAPCNKLMILSDMFPKVKFILVDPNEFVININGKPHYHTDSNITYLYSSNINMYKHKNRQHNIFNGEKLVVVDKDDEIERKAANRAFSSNKYDIAKYIKESNSNIFIIEDIMTNELSERLAPLDNVIFWSDIRTKLRDMLNNEKYMPHPGDFDLIWNLCQQHNWIHILANGSKSVGFMLKFRAPYIRKEDIDEVKEAANMPIFKPDFDKFEEITGMSMVDHYLNESTKTHKMLYLAGECHIQAFAGANSTETRLQGVYDAKKPFKKQSKEYDSSEYENKLFYYNCVQRPFGRHINPRKDKSNAIDLCGDCALEAVILEKYEKIAGVKIDGAKWMRDVFNATHRNRNYGGHGKLFDPITWDDVGVMREQALFNKE